MIRIGLVGCGSMGRTHAYAVANLPFFYRDLPFNARVTAVCARELEHARAAAQTYGLGRAMSEAELLASPDIDVIDICTPNVFHYETIRRALAAGKHVYCEKPLCVTEAEAFAAAREAAARGVTAGVVFNNRFLLPVMRAKALIDAGRLGRILSFRGAYFHSSAADPSRPAGWKQDRTVCGGGVLFDLGAHILDLIAYLCGPFAAVSGVGQSAYPTRTGRDGQPWQTNAEEAFYLTGRLASGAVGTVACGKIFCGTNDDLSFEIYGSAGALRFSLMDPNFLEFYDASAPETGFTRIECCNRYAAPGGVFPGAKAPIGWLRGHVGSMYAFLDAVHRGAPASPSFADGAHVQAVMEAAYRSTESGRMEEVHSLG